MISLRRRSRTPFYVMVTTFLYASTAYPDAEVRPPARADTVNSLWNDDQGFGIWISRDVQNCDNPHYVNFPFLVIGPSGSHEIYKAGTFSAGSIKTCAYFDMDMLPKSCKSGSLYYNFDINTQTYSGHYSFVIQDGRTIEGYFNAAHCQSKYKSAN
jgi:hypothetical protein